MSSTTKNTILSAEDTKKALQCCSKEDGIDCEHCPAKDLVCDKVVFPSVLKYVQHLEKENERLSEINGRLRRTIEDIKNGLISGIIFDK